MRMFKIYKISLHSAIDYAAEELKKYLRMMMPECGEITVTYCPDASDGFRLGLMQDFGLDVSDAEDTDLDDILYIDTQKDGGVIAGDNPRSVLLTTYEYLRQNGCRWLFPGSDGEFIPIVEELKPVQYRHMPSCRYRGQCNEGSEFQDNMIAAIDFTPKIGMNIFMQEFRIPTFYYSAYYEHKYNTTNRAPEPITPTTVLQYKRQCEAEIAKRGLQYHDIGHGFTVDPLGIDSSLRRSSGDNEKKVPPESRQYLALYKGERKLNNNIPSQTQFCMSSPEARRKIVQYVADYAEKSTHVDYVHLWLADDMNKHCECEKCAEKIPSDWYVMMLNELDEELTRRALPTRVVFIAYTDTVWAPKQEVIKNQERFTLLFAPIARRYTASLSVDHKDFELIPYKRNENVLPQQDGVMFAYLDDWRRMWKGKCLAYEYHFWVHQFYDVGGLELARIVNGDAKIYPAIGVYGMIQDCSQRSFFPTGVAFYSYARSMFDNDLSYEEIEEDYFSTAFGEDWKQFRDYLKELGEVFDQRYMEGQLSADAKRSPYYNPAHAKQLEGVKAVTEKGRELIKAHYNMPYRIQTASVRILERHTRYADLLADALIPLALGNEDEAAERLKKMADVFGKEEAYMENSYDHGLAFTSLGYVFAKRNNVIVD